MERESDCSTADLTDWDDPSLVRAVRERQDSQARQELLRRHLPYAVAIVRHQAEIRGASPPNADEATEPAGIAILVAMAGYLLPPEGEAPEASFRTFLGTVLMHDLQDGARRSVLAARLFVSGLPPDAWLVDLDNDPARLAERQEVLDRLHAVLGELGSDFQRLWEHKQSRDSLRQFADAHDLPDGRVKRRWQRGVRVIRSRLRIYFD